MSAFSTQQVEEHKSCPVLTETTQPDSIRSMFPHHRGGPEFTTSQEFGDPVYDSLLSIQPEAADRSNANEQQASKSIRSMTIMVEPPGSNNGVSTGGHLYFATSTGLSHEIEIGTALIPTVDEVVASNAFLGIFFACMSDLLRDVCAMPPFADDLRTPQQSHEVDSIERRSSQAGRSGEQYDSHDHHDTNFDEHPINSSTCPDDEAPADTPEWARANYPNTKLMHRRPSMLILEARDSGHDKQTRDYHKAFGEWQRSLTTRRLRWQRPRGSLLRNEVRVEDLQEDSDLHTGCSAGRTSSVGRASGRNKVQNAQERRKSL